MTKTVKFISGKEATEEHVMLFNVANADLTKKSFLNPFFFGDHEVNQIHFYDEEGIIVSVRGWFTKRFTSNNPFDSVSFVGGIANRRSVRLDRDEVFRVASPKRSTWGAKGNSIDVYVPFRALDAYGWAQVETTVEHEYSTEKNVDMYIGGECTEKDHLIRIGISTDTENHWDKKKEAMLKELSLTKDVDEFKEVLRNFSIYTR